MLFKDEAVFNAAVRGVFRCNGFKAVHVRETDAPGPLDLVVWKDTELVGWFELKIDDEQVRPSQIEFMRNNKLCSMVMRWLNDLEKIQFEWPGQARVKRMSWTDFCVWVQRLKDRHRIVRSLIEE